MVFVDAVTGDTSMLPFSSGKTSFLVVSSTQVCVSPSLGIVSIASKGRSSSICVLSSSVLGKRIRAPEAWSLMLLYELRQTRILRVVDTSA